MKRIIGVMTLCLLLPLQAHAEDFATTIQRCFSTAAQRNDVPRDVLLLLYENEGGTLGHVSHNSNGTVDIGPFQINQIWLPAVAQHWDLPKDITYSLLLGQLCANADAAAWILRSNLNAAHGDLWEAIGRYHSATPELKVKYLRQVYSQIVALLTNPQH